MSDPILNDFIVEIFKEGIKTGVKESTPFFKWIGNEIKARDILGTGVHNYRISLEERYSTFRIFCMSSPSPVRNLYVTANFLEELSARNYKSVENLEKFFSNRDAGNYQGVLTYKGLDLFNKINSKIIIYGKPGAGKITFLKRILLHSLDGEFERRLIPVFVTLKTWADSKKDLFTYIQQEFKVFNFPAGTLNLQELLKSGKCLILLDGLDEIPENYGQPCVSIIEEFVIEFFGNSFMMTCKIAARAHIFEQFAEVEITDFDQIQISEFVKNWFDQSTKAEMCERKIFKDPNILEMAKTPLLLTMLCAAYEGALDFPKNRAELYKEAIDVLLKKWDASRSQFQRNLQLVSNKTHYSPHGPDARISVKPGNARKLNYRKSMAVDTSEGVISHVQADFANGRDSQYLPAITQGLQNRLKENELTMANLLAGTGYSNGSNYSFLEQKGVTGWVPVFGMFKPVVPWFTYDNNKDQYTCMAGKPLPFKGFDHSADGRLLKNYWAASKDCNSCPLKPSCVPNIPCRKITRTPYDEQYQKAYIRQQSKRGKQMKKLRQSTVEPVFGSLTQYYGLSKISVLGKAGAHNVMLLAAIAFNLKKYLKTGEKKPSFACFKDIVNEFEQALFGLITFLTNPFQLS